LSEVAALSLVLSLAQGVSFGMGVWRQREEEEGKESTKKSPLYNIYCYVFEGETSLMEEFI